MSRRRRAKIVATLGPASSSIAQISELIMAGVNVARVNMSHGTHEGHAQTISNIREACKQTGFEIGVLLDLQGPKIRVDKLPQNLILKKGEEWVIGQTKLRDHYPQYKDRYIPTIYNKLVDDCHDGARILFDDGLIMAEAIAREGDVYKIKIQVGGELKSNKGINLPDCDVSAPSFTDKDKEDLIFGLKQGIDFIALSFVRKKEDILTVKYLLHALKAQVPIIAKIEKPQAITNLDEILSVTDAIMVARGDMGVELGNHLVPAVQKKIITSCNSRGIPVITATQMLESMILNPTPTRAEASDVANAIWDGTDAVMLSAETASGKYPIEAVNMMDKIIFEAEGSPKERPLLRNTDLSSISSSIMVSASLIAEKTGAKGIISVTQSGNSCKKISRFRPTARVWGVTNDLKVARRMSLYWGVSPFYIAGLSLKEEGIEGQVLSDFKKRARLSNGDKIVITKGDGKFFDKAGANSVRLVILKDPPTVLGASEDIEVAEFPSGKIHLDTRICASCQNCVATCPHEIWMVKNDESKNTTINRLRAMECTADMACVDVCPTGAIEIITK